MWNAGYDLDFAKHTTHWNAILKLGADPGEPRCSKCKRIGIHKVSRRDWRCNRCK